MMSRSVPTAISMWWIRSLLNLQKGINMSVNPFFDNLIYVICELFIINLT